VRIAEADRRLDQGGRLSTGVKDFFQGFCRAGAFLGGRWPVAQGISGLWRGGFRVIRALNLKGKLRVEG